MLNYIVRRLLQSVLVIAGATFIVFFVLFRTGDPTFLIASTQATQQEIVQLRHDLGFDKPWYEQYGHFMTHAVRGDFGQSLRFREPATRIVLEKLPATLELSIAAYGLALLLAIPIGIISATRRNSLWDNGAMLVALLGQSIPGFFLGIMLLWILGGRLGWFPIVGRGSGWLDGLHHLVLPAITLATFSMARNARLVRSSLLEVLGQEYVRTARAKGLREHSVTLRHALRNAVIPLVTIMGLEFGVLLGGAVVTETVFAWPGVGQMLLRSVLQKDFPVVVAAVTMLSILFVSLNLVIDLLYGFLDPRIRFA